MFDLIPIRQVIGAFGVVLAGSVWAQGEGAPSLQQAQAECASIAQQQTGSNPNAAPTTAPSQPQAGGRARGAAAGAMAGAAKGKSKANQYGNVPDEVAEEYTRNQAQDAATAGAVVGGTRQRQERRQSGQAQQAGPATASRLRQRLQPGVCLVYGGQRVPGPVKGAGSTGGASNRHVMKRSHHHSADVSNHVSSSSLRFAVPIVTELRAVVFVSPSASHRSCGDSHIGNPSQ